MIIADIVTIFNSTHYIACEQRNKVMERKDFSINDLHFKWNGTEYDVFYWGTHLKTLYDVFKATDDTFSNRFFLEYKYDLNDIINNSDFVKLIEFISLDKGNFFIYDFQTNTYKHNPHVLNRESYLKSLLDSCAPFRYIHYNDEEIVVHCNTINGEYKLHNPFNTVSDIDIDNAKIFNLMSTI